MVLSQFIALTFSACACVTAFAMDPDPSGQFALQIAGERTRAEVMSEAIAGVSAGQLRPSNPDASAHVQPMLERTRTRAQVEAEFLANRAEAMALKSEDGGAAYPGTSGKTPRAAEFATTGQ